MTARQPEPIRDRPAADAVAGLMASAGIFLGAIAIDVDDQRYLESRRMRHLREKHRTEFSGADQGDAHGFSRRAAGLQKVVKVHGEKSGEIRFQNWTNGFISSCPACAGHPRLSFLWYGSREWPGQARP